MVKNKELTIKEKFNLDTEEMTRAGLHFGHRTSRLHPKMKLYIEGVINTVHTIDLQKTKDKLTEALEFIQKLISEEKTLLVVGTKIQLKDLVKRIAGECGLPYITERWLGGTFTNFATIFKRIEYYKDLERRKAEGELEKYTKKEMAEFDQKLKNLEIKFGGIKNLTKPPEAVIICDIRKDKLAVKEAKMKGVIVIGICDTNTDPTLTDYPIPANDDAISSVKYILEKVSEVVRNAKLKTPDSKLTD